MTYRELKEELDRMKEEQLNRHINLKVNFEGMFATYYLPVPLEIESDELVCPVNVSIHEKDQQTPSKTE